MEHQGTWQGLASASAQNTGWRSDEAPAGVLRTVSPAVPSWYAPPHPKVHAESLGWKEAGTWVRQSGPVPFMQLFHKHFMYLQSFNPHKP